MNTFKDNYELHILSKAINNCIDKFLPAEANKALYLILHQSDDLVWEISTSIFLISGHKVDFSLVRDLANARVESLKILGLEQLEAEIKRKVEEEATRIEKARLNAEQEAHRKAEEEEKLKQAGFNLEENENRFSLEVEVFYKLQGIIVDKLEVEADRVTLDSNVTEDLGADELDVTELIMAIEEEFEIELNQEFAPELKFSFWGSSEDRPGYVAHYSIRDLLNAVISEI
jgi:acyl carrier protein